MAIFDTPSISVTSKSNEQNISSANAWMNQTSDALNYYIPYLESRIEALENAINELKKEE